MKYAILFIPALRIIDVYQKQTKCVKIGFVNLLFEVTGHFHILIFFFQFLSKRLANGPNEKKTDTATVATAAVCEDSAVSDQPLSVLPICCIICLTIDATGLYSVMRLSLL